MTQPRKEQINVLRAYWSTFSYTATAGSGSTNIAQATLEAASVTGTYGGSYSIPQRGIITIEGEAFVKLRDANTGNEILDANGDVIYGSLQFLFTNYVVTYYKKSGGFQAATTLPANTDIEMLFAEVMEFGEVPAKSFILDQAGWSNAPKQTLKAQPIFVAVAGVQGTNVVSPNYTGAGATVLDPTTLDGYADGYYLFQAILETTSISLPAEVLLYNVTDGVEVATFSVTPLTTTSVGPALLERQLILGTDIMPYEVVYQVRIRFESGAPLTSDRVTCSLAQIKVT
jgi:hypothetical protein